MKYITKKSINKSKYKINYVPGVYCASMLRVHGCVFCSISLLSVYKVHCGSAFEPGASRLPYYCTSPVRVPAVIGALAVGRQKKKMVRRVAGGEVRIFGFNIIINKKKNKQSPSLHFGCGNGKSEDTCHPTNIINCFNHR